MAFELLPAEIWQTILRYAIAVPVFFDSDALENWGLADFISRYQDEDAYWEAEKYRNAFRRVCFAWNIYLQQFNHRFIRMNDVLKDHIPISAISQAIRLENYAVPRNGSDYSYACRILNKAISSSPGPWSLEILDGAIPEMNEVILQSNRISNLKCILGCDMHTIGQARALLPTLMLILADGRVTTLSMKHLKSSMLTTLRIDEVSLNACCTWDLPSLRHFSFRVDSLTPLDFTNMLRSIGKNLITCMDNSRPTNAELPDEIWTLSPQLQHFKTSFIWPTCSSLPTSLFSITIPIEIVGWQEQPTLHRFPAIALLTAGITDVRFDWRWCPAVQYDVRCLEYLLFGIDYGIFLRDEEGTSFQDFIVATLSYYWKGNCKSMDHILKDVVTSRF